MAESMVRTVAGFSEPSVPALRIQNAALALSLPEKSLALASVRESPDFRSSRGPRGDYLDLAAARPVRMYWWRKMQMSS